jgi:hypothetical protein
MAPLASWYRRTELQAEAERTINHAIRQSQAPAEAITHRNHWTPGDARQLRGIPVVGVHGGLGGAITGTKPHSRNW